MGGIFICFAFFLSRVFLTQCSFDVRNGLVTASHVGESYAAANKSLDFNWSNLTD